MWLNVRWYAEDNTLLREDGAYGPIGVTLTHPFDPNISVAVESIIDPQDSYTKIYEAHYAMTQEWADQLIALGYAPELPLSFDRLTGSVDFTLEDLSFQEPGTYHETFHFVLNNKVAKDNRIPPYGMSYKEARKRNALPVPADQYGCDQPPCSTYDYFDLFTLDPPTVEGGYPADATYATIEMKYQPTSWEYIQFLYLANNGQNAFLAEEGVNLLAAWLSTDMAPPYVMASTVWGSPPVPQAIDMISESLATWSVSKQGQLVSPASTFSSRDNVGIRAHVVDDPDGSPLAGAQVFVEIKDSTDALVVSLQGFSDDAGNADLQWKIPRRQAAGSYTATVTNIIKSGYLFAPGGGQDSVQFTIQ
jgi:hypothetical protein